MSRRPTSGPARPRFRPRWNGVVRHPNESVKNRLAYRQFEAALSYAADRYARGPLVDVGGSRKPWAALFAPYVTEHVSVDHVQRLSGGKPQVDIVAPAYDIPLPDGYAETILLTEVLEHLEQPLLGLRECARLLAPGGHLIVTTPFFWPVHDPRDYFRYPPAGLRWLAERARLDVVEIAPLGGLWSTISLELGYGLQRYRRRWTRPLVDVVIAAAQHGAAHWEAFDHQPKFSWNHLMVAQRAAPHTGSDGM